MEAMKFNCQYCHREYEPIMLLAKTLYTYPETGENCVGCGASLRQPLDNLNLLFIFAQGVLIYGMAVR